MKSSGKRYDRLAVLAVLILLLLVSLQIVWVVNAVQFQERAIVHRLKEVVGDVGLEVNQIDHSAFHGSFEPLSHIPIDTLNTLVNAYLHAQGISEPTYFAIYQDTNPGIFISNGTQFQEQLLDSEIRSCLSSIISFSLVPDLNALDKNNQTIDSARLDQEATFQYYSPVTGLEKPSGKTLWLSLYQPGSLSAALQSLTFLLLANFLLVLALIFLIAHLIRSLSRHKQLSSVKDDFFNNMTHEFKTPISSIRLASRVLRKETNPEKRTTFYDLIEKESKSLEHQIDMLLELSLLDNNAIRLERMPIDFCELISTIPHRLQPQLDDRKGHLQLDCQLTSKAFPGDHHHLLNSLCNLVENSLKYAPPGVKIEVRAWQISSRIFLAVRDDGPGIPEEHQAQIFGRFYRGQSEHAYKGAGFGIGLSYVKSIVEAHQGTIELNKNYLKGTEFIITL